MAGIEGYQSVHFGAMLSQQHCGIMFAITKQSAELWGACILAFFLLGAYPAAGEVVRISTLNWPPYTSQELPSGGATAEVVRAAFAKMGHKVEFEFRPWIRAIEMADVGNDGVIAYFPGYHCRHRERFVRSEPIGYGPLGFAEHADAPIKWTSLDDIEDQNLKIGTVLGYSNTDEFDARVKAGSIRAVASSDDLTNLRKLLRKRIDAIVVDRLVMEYLKLTQASLSDGASDLVFNARPLELKTLYVCFRGDEEGKRLKQIFNSGLDQVDIEATVRLYFNAAFGK
jgi:polar amino acid transport system substrate-binding protein